MYALYTNVYGRMINNGGKYDYYKDVIVEKQM